MPHLILDYSADIDVDIDQACQILFDTMASHETFPDADAIKLRAAPWAHYVSGTKGGQFAHATVRLLSGRSDSVKSDLSASLVTAMQRAFPDTQSLTVEIRDMDRASYGKHTR